MPEPITANLVSQTWTRPFEPPESIPNAADVVIIGGVSKLRALRETNLLYDGKHIGLENVTSVQGSRIVATPVDNDAEVLLDVDGEAPGALPATFELLPKVLKLRV